MTYTQVILLSALLNIGMVYIVYRQFIRIQELEKTLRGIVKQAEDVIRKAMPKKPPAAPPKSKIPWYKYYRD